MEQSCAGRETEKKHPRREVVAGQPLQAATPVLVPRSSRTISSVPRWPQSSNSTPLTVLTALRDIQSRVCEREGRGGERMHTALRVSGAEMAAETVLIRYQDT